MAALLEVDSLIAGYGPVRVLHGLSLFVEEGETVAVLGPNGAGKSTLMNTIAGLTKPTGGTVSFAGRGIHGASAEAITRGGLALVPEGRRVFAHLTVMENLRMGAYPRRDRAAVAREMSELLERFPVLADRRGQRAGTLSGGEQQQLAICRALMSSPRMILLDEPSLGLAPVMVERVFDLVRELGQRDGLTVLLVEQNVANALGAADRAYVVTGGRVERSGTSAEMAGAARELEASYLGGPRS